MTWKFQKITQFIDFNRRLVADDWDNVMLFTGQERAGKSTVAVQIMKELKPTMELDRIHFTTQSFLADAPALGRGDAILGDEMDLDRRNSMARLRKALVRFFKDSGGLNLHVGMCFPHKGRLDDAVYWDRVRWHIHVERRGVFDIYQRLATTRVLKTGEVETVVRWVHRGRFRFSEGSGEFWEGYLKRKEAHMRTKDWGVLEAQAALSSGVDHGAAVEFFRRVRRSNDEGRGPGASIRDVP